MAQLALFFQEPLLHQVHPGKNRPGQRGAEFGTEGMYKRKSAFKSQTSAQDDFLSEMSLASQRGVVPAEQAPLACCR